MVSLRDFAKMLVCVHVFSIGQIFSKYVVAMVQNSATKTSEIKELSELRETLGLDGLLMGEALYQVRKTIERERQRQAESGLP